MHHNQSNKSRF